MLLTAALAGFRPRGLAAVALAGALAYNLTPYAMLIPYRVDNRPAAVSFWRPAIGFLRYNLLPGHRVEVVPTAAHWEAYWIPRAGFALARGWYRQLDVVDNPALYRPGLGRRAYGRWLREWAVEYVLLPKTPLDPYGGTREAALVRSGAAGLVRVARTGAWTIYAVPNATSILDGPGPATVRHFGHSSITGTVGAPGRYLLRVHYSPYWKARDVACISRGPNQMTYLDFLSSGSFSLRVTSTPDGLFDAATAPYEHC
jgi:hypothetical protein